MAELHVIGSLEGGTDFSSANLFCKFKIETGSAWRLLEGATEGQTHVDFPAVRRRAGQGRGRSR